MKLTRRLGFLMLAGILASCTACGSETTPVPVKESIQEETDNSVSSSEETPVSESEENSDTQELKLDHLCNTVWNGKRSIISLFFV